MWMLFIILLKSAYMFHNVERDEGVLQTRCIYIILLHIRACPYFYVCTDK